MSNNTIVLLLYGEGIIYYKKKRKKEGNKMERNEYLEKLNLLMQNGDVWLSSLDLANISERNHFHVLRDIREDIKNGITNSLNTLSTQSKFGLGFTNIITDAVRKIKVIESERITTGGRVTYYLLNKEAALMCLMRYSPEVRMVISNLFFKSVDLMKSKGYIINNVDDMYRATEEEFKMNSDMFLDDLKEDGVLSDFNAFYLLDVLMRKIPEELNEYFCDNFPLYKRIRRQVFEKGDNEYTITHNIKPILGKNIKKK